MPALTTAVFSAWRGGPSQSTRPVSASSAKNWPLAFSDRPNKVLSTSTGLLRNSETSVVSHTTSTDQAPSRRVGRSAVTPMPWLLTMSVSPCWIGVMALGVPRDGHGCSHSRVPSGTETPSTLLLGHRHDLANAVELDDDR